MELISIVIFDSIQYYTDPPTTIAVVTYKIGDETHNEGVHLYDKNISYLKSTYPDKVSTNEELPFMSDIVRNSKKMKTDSEIHALIFSL